VALSSDVLFDSGSARLKPGAEDKLREVAGVLGRYPRTRLEIIGHTDSHGSTASNEALSQRRANAVRDELARDGVDPQRIVTQGLGASRPVATNDTPEGRAENRRVEILSRPDDSFVNQGRAGSGEAPPPAPADEPR